MISGANQHDLSCDHHWKYTTATYEYAPERWHITQACSVCGMDRALGLTVIDTTPWSLKEATDVGHPTRETEPA